MDRFKILSKIGEGAYSTVYMVKRLEDENIYALKKVKIKDLSKKEKNNALNEIRILASVNSPYIISYKESFIDDIDQTLCIVMEYANDGDLFEKIRLYKKNNTHFYENDIWKIFIQITKGLNDLHEYNILHRDLKSANVFLFKNGNAKLGDLNVSKITSRGVGCTQTGTPYYASPEVWKDKPYNYKSDIWSLGCVFYEIINLVTPFRANSMSELYKKVMSGEYPPINKNFDKNFQVIIDRILKVKPEERPTTNEILDMDEVKYKIEDLNLFNVKNLKKFKGLNVNKSCDDYNNIINFNTEYLSKMEKIKILKRNVSQIISNTNSKNSKNTKNKNDDDKVIDDLLITKLSYSNSNNDNKIKLNKLITKNKKLNFSKLKKPEAVDIFQKNFINFQNKMKEKKKIVLSTIKCPKKLYKLNNGKLPPERYSNNDNDYIYNQYSPPWRNNFLPLHLLPKIKKDENKNANKSIDMDLSAGKNNLLNNEKPTQKNSINILKKQNSFNTIQMKINPKQPLNFYGKINIIVEE